MIPNDPDFQQDQLIVDLPIYMNLHPMQTRSKSGIVKRNVYSASVVINSPQLEPKTFKAAAKILEWQSAMQEEITALHSQQTWFLVPLPPHKNLVGCSDPKLVSDVIVDLTKKFDMKDLGILHYFLGLQIQYTSDGLFVSQSKYTKELIDKVDLQDCKPCATPCLPYHRLLKNDGRHYHSPDQYRNIVGALQYLTFTRPGIAFSVNQACQFMHNPMESHVIVVKQIIRYLQGTSKYGLRFQSGPIYLQSYSDVDWAGDPNDKRSASGFIVFLGSNPISWTSNKQHTVSRSSTEAEYRAFAITAAELAWIR
ncbi:uncharacterized mitochondrial protein AtMg00810-like [Malus sylvestris]|uniref:uncharacterized mitochondrial protein AtMg00810-like n=1 Tax=Malus sylvestris TaxID=3752 RepID=UPI0021ABF4C7|nr:uncharacterized mitochondrial protein AtMg00810-like [Malus sylvestris]